MGNEGGSDTNAQQCKIEKVFSFVLKQTLSKMRNLRCLAVEI